MEPGPGSRAGAEVPLGKSSDADAADRRTGLPPAFSGEFLSDLASFRREFFKTFLRGFRRYDTGVAVQNKALHCSTFCAMIGLRRPQHCEDVVRATFALSKCSFTTDEVRQVLELAMVNINRKFDYMAELDGRKRAGVAVCHIYIAQAILQDDFAEIKAFSMEIWDTEETAGFFSRVLAVMCTWAHRVVVRSEEMAEATTIFAALAKKAHSDP
jgi:hypothetical protein